RRTGSAGRRSSGAPARAECTPAPARACPLASAPVMPLGAQGTFSPASGPGGDLGRVSTRDVIATTKLTIPTSRRALVPRPDLSARLDDADYRVAIVAAPAGYGKTAMLSSWAVAQPHDLAWLSCDAADAE